MRKVGKIYVPDADTEWTPVIESGKYKSYMEAEIQCAMDAISNRTTGTSSGCAVDVGANIGLFSRRIAQYFPEVLAFEPFEDTCNCLRLNTPENVTGSRIAISNYTGEIEMADPNGQKKSGHRRYALPNETGTSLLPVDRLDSYPFSFGLSLIKVDVQGMEWEVIDGAMNILEKHRPVVILEEHRAGSTTRAFKTTGRILQEIGGDLVGLFDRNVVISL